MTTPPAVIYSKSPISIVSPPLIEELKKMATNHSLKRARLCLHISNEDQIQEMVIVLDKDTYIRPHRHPKKTESLHLIEGELLVVFFSEEGRVEKSLHLSAEGDMPFLYRLSESLWHTVIPLSKYVVFHEVITGPFSAPEYPTWEPVRDLLRDLL